MTRVAISGYKGRMGQALLRCAPQHFDLQVTGQVDLGDEVENVVQACDVVIEFSSHDATAELARACARHGTALVVGTTGHSDRERQEVLEAGRSLAIVWASNYSTGVNVLFWLARRAAESLGPSFDLEVIEMHHRHKKDAPSGTALTLAHILAGVRRLNAEEAMRHGRHGLVGERDPAEIGMHSLRGGDVVGDHTVVFAAPGERVELSHRVSSRDTFANGALRAAAWIRKRPPGLYDMQQVLGLA